MASRKIQVVNSIITTDKTLTLDGVAADAKAVGEALGALSNIPVADNGLFVEVSYDNDVGEYFANASYQEILDHIEQGRSVYLKYNNTTYFCSASDNFGIEFVALSNTTANDHFGEPWPAYSIKFIYIDKNDYIEVSEEVGAHVLPTMDYIHSIYEHFNFLLQEHFDTENPHQVTAEQVIGLDTYAKNTIKSYVDEYLLGGAW